MYENWIRIGFFVLGGLLGLSCSAFFVIGFRARTRTESGQKLFGKTEVPDPVVNTSREFMDGIEQDRLQKKFQES